MLHGFGPNHGGNGPFNSPNFPIDAPLRFKPDHLVPDPVAKLRFDLDPTAQLRSALDSTDKVRSVLDPWRKSRF